MDIFHRHREAQEPELADAMLELALQTPEYRPEALIWKGIDALPNDPKLAFIYLSNAANALPDRADVHALLGRSMLAQGRPDLATRYLSAVWQKLPNDPSLRMILWQARSQSANPAELRRMILAHLPDITAPNELNFVLKILAAQTDAPGTVGVVRYLPEEKEIQGWAVDLRNVHAPAALVLEANANTLSVVANVAHPLLTAAGLPATHGGIRIKVPNPTLAVTVRFATGLPLLGSPVSAMPTFVPPPPLPDVGKHQPVDVLIPVYDGLEETLECINSAIAARKLNRTPHRLVVVDDATPVPALRKALKVLASKGKITLIQQPVNLGFIRTMNRAMALSPRQDVVWLNADTRVHGNWLDRLRDTAYGSDDIASVTPFTNNGELMSFPTSRVSSPMPTAEEQAELDRLASDIASPAVELETGCGFCLYIKRVALDAVGYLDEVHLSRGYGEETDWCLRARRSGWRHMGATHVFVAHKGGVSFGEEKKNRVAYNNAILRKRFPTAESDYELFCQRDPLRVARNALQSRRLASVNAKVSDDKTLRDLEVRISDRKTPSSIEPTNDSDSSEKHLVELLYRACDSSIAIQYLIPEENPELAEHIKQIIDMSPDIPRSISGTFEGIASQLSEKFQLSRFDYATALDEEKVVHKTMRDQPATYLIIDDLAQEVAARLWSKHLVCPTQRKCNCVFLSSQINYIGTMTREGVRAYAISALRGLGFDECALLAGADKVATLLEPRLHRYEQNAMNYYLSNNIPIYRFSGS